MGGYNILKVMKLFSKLKLRMASDPQVVDYFRRKGVNIGEGCSIAKNVLFGSEPYLITIGNKVRLTQGVKFITHDGSMWVLRNMKLLEGADKFGQIVIGDNVNIGWNTTIMLGVTIGNNVIVGAGSVVTKDLDSDGVYAGVPAKRICSVMEYYEKNKKSVDFTKSMSPKNKKDYLERKYKEGKYEN